MNKALLDSAYTVLKQSVSALTTNVFFDHIPDQKLLSELCVTYLIRNTSNENTFDGKETNKQYSIDVKFTHPVLTNVQNQSIYSHKDGLYENLSCSYISLVDEDLFYDPELNVWTAFYRYEVQSA
jgi:hypothetical protein